MRIWTQIDPKSGYGSIKIRGEAAPEQDALSAMIPGDGFCLVAVRSEDGLDLEISVVPSSAEVAAEAADPELIKMDKEDLDTLAAEKGVKVAETDRRADLIRKLSSAKPRKKRAKSNASIQVNP